MKSQKPRIGLALDSGGVKGGAHIGVLEVFAEHEIPIDMIAGSSAGAFVGAAYATGRLPYLKEIIDDLGFRESLSYYFDPVFPISGLLAGKRARGFIHDVLGDVLIEDLPIRYVAVTTDLLTGEMVPIDSGPVVDAVMASVSMPGIFKPVVYRDRLLTDGGVCNPLPVDVINRSAPAITVACNLHPRVSDMFTPDKRKAIIQDEEQSTQEDKEYPEWFLGLMRNIKVQRMVDGVRPVMNTLRGRIKGVSLTEIDFLSGLQEQLHQSTERISAAVEQSILRRDESNALNIFEIMITSTNIQQYQKNHLMLQKERTDVLIEPDVLDLGAMEFTKVESTIEVGRMRAEEAMPQLERLMAERL